MLVTATFLGPAVSLGFTPLVEYTLQLEEGAYYGGCCLRIRHTDYPYQVVPYDSWATFLDNWGNVNKCKDGRGPC